jgi:hypothetical protein
MNNIIFCPTSSPAATVITCGVKPCPVLPGARRLDFLEEEEMVRSFLSLEDEVEWDDVVCCCCCWVAAAFAAAAAFLAARACSGVPYFLGLPLFLFPSKGEDDVVAAAAAVVLVFVAVVVEVVIAFVVVTAEGWGYIRWAPLVESPGGRRPLVGEGAVVEMGFWRWWWWK